MAPASIKTAMILAAGLGTRMRPLTDDRPKPMVELAGRPLIDHVLQALQRADIATAVINLHYRPERLEVHLRKRRQPPAVLFSDERDRLLDSGGGIRKALPQLGPAPFVLCNADSVSIEDAGRTDNLGRLIAAFDAERMDSLLLLADANNSVGYAGKGDFFMDAEGRLQRRGAAPACPFVYAGVAIVHPRLFADSPEGAFSINSLWDRAIAAGRLHGLAHRGLWLHVGDPQALAEAEKTMCLRHG